MPTVNVSRVLKNPRFAQDFIVHRKTGSFVNGRWTQTELTPITLKGVVTAGGTKDIMQVPEADRSTQLVCFHSTEELFITHKDSDFSGTSDEIEWRGSRYRLFKVLPWVDFGYYKAFGTSMEGD